MSVFEFENRGGNGNGWNYSDPNKEGYMLQIQGTVVEVKEVPATKYNSNEIDRWPDGKPKLNVCLTIQGQSGRELDWTFSPGGASKPTPAMAACRGALQAAGKEAKSVVELGGLMVQVSTQAPPQGFTYGQGNPRPWTVQVLGQGTVPFRGVKKYEELQAQAQAPMQQPVQQQPVQQPVPQAPVAPPAEDVPYYEQDIPF